MSCAKIVRPVFIHHSSGASGMAREYLRRQIDFGLFHGQAHIYTQLNDLSEIDSWTLLIADFKFQIENRGAWFPIINLKSVVSNYKFNSCNWMQGSASVV